MRIIINVNAQQIVAAITTQIQKHFHWGELPLNASMLTLFQWVERRVGNAVNIKKKLANEIINCAHEIIRAIEFCQKHRTSEKYFTRLHCTGFSDVFMLCLNFLKKTLQVEVDRYMAFVIRKLKSKCQTSIFNSTAKNITRCLQRTI